MADLSFVTETANKTLTRWSLPTPVAGQVIADLVTDGVAYWEQSLPDGSHLSLVRLFSPVVRREEVFLGNVLLNDFFSKALIRAVEEKNLGRMAHLANDLENYYYLYHGKATSVQMSEHLREEVAASLINLYFGDEDPSRGIYGDVRRMLTFYRSNIEPFPAFAVPRFLLSDLLRKVDEHLLRLIDDEETNINVILALLSFFYSKDGAEMQSFYGFLSRAMTDGLLPANKMRAVFALQPGEDFDKNTFTERKKGQLIDRALFQETIQQFLSHVRQQINQGQAEQLSANLASKMPSISLAETINSLTQGMQLGFVPLKTMEKKPAANGGLPCRFCGGDIATIVEKNITGGFGAGRFYNQSPKLRPFEEALCGRCGISSYLVTKLLGMHIARPQPKAKDFPVSKQYNIVFHYGRHDEAAARQLAATVDDLFSLIRALQQKAWDLKRFFSVEYIQEEIARRAKERRAGEDVTPSAEEAITFLLADGAMVPGLETLGQMRRDVEAQVLPLGAGDYRLLAFILPQLQAGRSEALDFVQRRFSGSRLAAFTLLALLRKLCDCDGPYYFQSMPTLAPDGFNSNTFYVQGKAENADQALRRYSAIVNFARRVVRYHEGHSILADWILLAERLEKDPLGVFSEVLRDSPMRGGDDLRQAQYKRLCNDFIRGTGMIDGIEYLKLMERLKEL